MDSQVPQQPEVVPHPNLEPQPASVSSGESKNPFKSKLVTICLGLIALGALIRVGVYFLEKQPVKQEVVQVSPTLVPSNTPTNTPVPDPTANWKTYTNSKYGFSMQYPSNWTVIDKSAEVGVPTTRFEGAEGNVSVSFGKGFGGGCDPQFHIKVQTLRTYQDICDQVLPDGTENLGMIGKDISTSVSLASGGRVNPPLVTNREVILKIFSTFTLSQ